MFSSDLFGGLTEEFSLYAKSVDDYFEAAKPFHKHYMPSKEVLTNALLQVQKKTPKMIAPQHGSIIKEEFINPLIEKLKNLECGLYLLNDLTSDLYILNTADELLKKFLQDTVSLSSFELVLRNLFNNIKHVIPTIKNIEIYGLSPLSNKEYAFSFTSDSKIISIDSISNENIEYEQVLIQNEKEIGKIYIKMDREFTKREEEILHILLDRISIPISISLQKELILKELEESNHTLHEKAIRDPLTKLYNREYLQEILLQKIESAKRYNFPITVAMLDIDFFKHINDTYGHIIGDCVLQEIAYLLNETFRTSDIAIRYGGEEFFIIMPFTEFSKGCDKLEKFRKLVEHYIFCDKKQIRITISIGVCSLNDEDINELIQKADNNLYKAKKEGRNRVICDL